MATLKGGTGKTLNTFNIAGILAENSRVLLIDIDPQCDLTSNCGIDSSNTEVKTIRDIFENLDLIPSSILLFKTEKMLSTRSNKEHILDYFLQNNESYLNQYDYIMIDTNPSISAININGFYVADSIILSSDISSNSISGAELFCALWEDTREEMAKKENNVRALILCNVDRRSNLINEIKGHLLSENYSIPNEAIVNTVIPMTVKLKDTEIEHKPINILYPKENIKKIYDSVILELKEKGVL